MEYVYEVPIVVTVISDEHEDQLPVRRSIVDFVIRNLPNSSWRDSFPNSVENCFVEPIKDRILVRIFTNSLVYSQEENDQVLLWLTDWMRYGYFDSGLTVPGRYYGYAHDEIVVNTWDNRMPIITRTRAINVEPRP